MLTRLPVRYTRSFSEEGTESSEDMPTLRATAVVGAQSLEDSSGTTFNKETGFYELNEGTASKEVWETVAKMANFKFAITHPALDWQPVVSSISKFIIYPLSHRPHNFQG